MYLPEVEPIARGGDVGPLHGVPMTIKDSINVAGISRGPRLPRSAVRRWSASARSTRAPSFLSPPWASFARAELGGRIGDLRGIPDGAERERGSAVEAGVVPECALL